MIPYTTGLHPAIWLAAVALVILGTASGVIVPAWLKYRDDIADIRENVSNDHQVNLREELDERHREVMAVLSAVRLGLTRVEHRTARIGEETRDNREDIEALRATMYDEIRKTDHVIAKHHPAEAELIAKNRSAEIEVGL